MKYKIVACFILLSIFFESCAQNKVNIPNAIKEISGTLNASSFKEAISKPGIQVLDVRTATEFKEGHLKHALQANWLDQKEFLDRTQHLNKSVPVYVYCQAGGRSASAQESLIKNGYVVVNLEGGMSNWKMNGLPVEGSGGKSQMRVQDFNQIIHSNEIVLVDIGADWCPPCRKMLPVLDQLKNKPTVPYYFLAVDGGVDIDVMKSLKSEGLPTFLIFKNGKEVWRHQGLVSLKEFNKALL